MDKEKLRDAIDNLDDELIDEAEKARGLSYRAKMRIVRTLIVGAAAAAMVTTALLIHLGSRKPSGDGGEVVMPPEAVTEQSTAEDGGTEITTALPETVMAETSGAAVTEVTTVSAVASTVKVTTVSVADTSTVTLPDEPAAAATTEFTFDKDGLFKAPENYSYQGDPEVICVKYSNAYLRERYGLWINCDTEQSDRDLDLVSGFDLTDEAEDIGFEGGGFLLRVFYRDGTFMEYELFDSFGILYITERDGTKNRWKDLSGNSYELLMQLQSDQLAVDEYINIVVEEYYS